MIQPTIIYADNFIIERTVSTEYVEVMAIKVTSVRVFPLIVQTRKTKASSAPGVILTNKVNILL